MFEMSIGGAITKVSHLKVSRIAKSGPEAAAMCTHSPHNNNQQNARRHDSSGACNRQIRCAEHTHSMNDPNKESVIVQNYYKQGYYDCNENKESIFLSA